MEVVSFETALRLKEAGFPQPEIIEKHAAYYIDDFADKGIVVALGFSVGYPWPNHFVYAPSATDIVSKLGFHWCLIREENNIWYVVQAFPQDTPTARGYLSENPAEAAAAAWLAKK